jgi:host factor-I protein
MRRGRKVPAEQGQTRPPAYRHPPDGMGAGRDLRPCDKETARQKKAKNMAADKQNLQDAFLNHVRKGKVPVTIFLINGVKLQGVITWFDNFCVLLRRDGQSQLVYKHAISTIMPGAPINLYEAED